MVKFKFLEIVVINDLPNVIGYNLDTGLVERFRIQEVKFLNPTLFEKLENQEESKNVVADHLPIMYLGN